VRFLARGSAVAEQAAHNRQVDGSIPSPATTSRRSFIGWTAALGAALLTRPALAVPGEVTELNDYWSCSADWGEIGYPGIAIHGSDENGYPITMRLPGRVLDNGHARFAVPETIRIERISVEPMQIGHVALRWTPREITLAAI
jgi:hypothetical protein